MMTSETISEVIVSLVTDIINPKYEKMVLR